MKPVLLTGATGFIGQRLQKALLDDGRNAAALIRPESSHKDRLLEGVESLSADLSDTQSLLPAISEASAVIYCAGSVRGRRLKDFRAANIDGIRSLVEAMNQADSEVPLLLISSLAASRPRVSDYANSKHLGEQEVMNRAHFPWTIFRPPAVYGPGDKEMLPILKLARKGLVTPTGPAGQRLSLVHVDDLASAVLAWLDSWQQCRNQVFTLDDGHEGGYDWREIAETASGGNYRLMKIPAWLLFGVAGINLSVSRLLGYAPMLTPGKARELTQADWVCNNKDLSEACGWAPSITLEQGLLSLLGSP
jgi:nucleoside-diphosphate-sugar epimerase